jgi:hypothetical protein
MTSSTNAVDFIIINYYGLKLLVYWFIWMIYFSWNYQNFSGTTQQRTETELWIPLSVNNVVDLLPNYFKSTGIGERND